MAQASRRGHRRRRGTATESMASSNESARWQASPRSFQLAATIEGRARRSPANDRSRKHLASGRWGRGAI